MFKYIHGENFNVLKECIKRIELCNTFLNNPGYDREKAQSELSAVLKSIADAYNERNEDKQIENFELFLLDEKIVVIFDDKSEKMFSVDEFCDHFKKELA